MENISNGCQTSSCKDSCYFLNCHCCLHLNRGTSDEVDIDSVRNEANSVSNFLTDSQEEMEELQSLVGDQSEINDFFSQQMQAKLHVVDERKDKLKESISALRISIDDMLSEKEDEIINDLNRMQDQLKIILKTRLMQNEQIIQKLYSFKHLTPSTEQGLEKSRFIDCQPDHFQKLLRKDIQSFTLFDDLDLRLDIDERFRRIISRLQSFPLGRVAIVESNGCTSKVLQTSAKDTDIKKFHDLIKKIENEHYGYRENLNDNSDNYETKDLQQIQQPSFSTVCASVSSVETPLSEIASDPISTNSDSDNSSSFSYAVSSRNNETAPIECLHNNGTVCRKTSTTRQSTRKLFKYALRIRNFMTSFRECSKRDVNKTLIGTSNIETLSIKKLSGQHLSVPLKVNSDDFEPSFDLNKIKPDNKQTNEVKNDQITEGDKEIEYATGMNLTPTSSVGATALDDVCKDKMELAFHTNNFSNWLASIPRSPNEVAVLSGRAQDEVNCWLTDVILLPDSEYIVVFDAINKNLKKFEILTGKFLDRVYLHSEKSNICLFSAIEIVATLPEEKKIVFVSFLNNLEISREISTDREYRGITTITKKLVCSSCYEMCIDILSNDGILLTSIKLSTLNTKQYFFPGYLAASEDEDILISDSVNKCVLCVNIHTVTLKFAYYGQDNCLLTWPAGVAVDKKGYIYIADCFKNKIHMLTPDGKFDRFFMSEGDGVDKYRAIDVNDHMLVTTTYNKSDIGVYLLTQLKIPGL